MNDELEAGILHSGRFGRFAVDGVLIQGNGACGKPRRGWVLTLREAAKAENRVPEHRYWVCESDFREVIHGDLRENISGVSSYIFNDRIAEVPRTVLHAAQEAIGAWETALQPVEDRCMSRCTAAKRMGTDFCTVF